MSTARFSLAPPPEGNGSFGAIDIIGVPDLEWLIKFSNGNVGIAQSCFDNFFRRQSAGLDADIADIFNPLMEQNNSIPSQGLPAMESTLVKSIFETQKPYIEAVLSVLDALTVVEDVIAVLLAGGKVRSLKPKTNSKSLYTKLNGIRTHLENVRKQTKPAYSSFKDIPFGSRITGVNADVLLSEYQKKPVIIEDNAFGNYTFVTISEFYSTGEFIPEVPYDYTYIDIIDQNVPIEVPPFESPEPRNDDSPPVIIFDVWVDPLANGKIKQLDSPNDLPNDWDISTKWFGKWDGYTKDPNSFAAEYENITFTQLDEELDRGGVDDLKLRQQIKDIYRNALPPYRELYDQLVAGNFKESIFIEINNDARNSVNTLYGRTDAYASRNTPAYPPKKEPIGDVWHNQNDEFGYKPRKINGNWIDPEVDYELRLVRVFPQYAPVRPYRRRGNLDVGRLPNSILNSLNNTNLPPQVSAINTNNRAELSGSNPLVFNYGDDVKVDELLTTEDYDPVTPSFTYPTNNYIIDKEYRSYSDYERSGSRQIIDKIRKNNSRVIEKLIIGELTLNGDIEQIINDIINEQRLGNLAKNSPADIFYTRLLSVLKYPVNSNGNVIIRRPNVTIGGGVIPIRDAIDSIVDYITKRFEDRVPKFILEEFGGISNFRNIFDNAVTNLSNRVTNGEGSFQISDLLVVIDTDQNFRNLRYAEQVLVNGGLPKPDRDYGKIIQDNIYTRSASLLGGLNPLRIYDVIKGSIRQEGGTGEIPDFGSGFQRGDLIPRGTSFNFNESGPAERTAIELVNPSNKRVEPPREPRNGDTLRESLFIDIGIFYVVEGVYKNRKDMLNQKFNVSLSGSAATGANSSGERFYKYGKSPIRQVRSLLAAISKFAQFGGSALPSLIKETSKALSVLKNPANLIFEILMEQLSDTLSAFDPDILSKFQQLRSISDNEEKRAFIKDDPVLRNYIALDEEFNYRFIFDGLGVLSVFGQNFGIGTKDLLPKLVLESNGLPRTFCNNIPPDRGGNRTGNYDVNGNRVSSDLKGNELDPNGGSPNRSIDRVPEGTTFEIIDIEYSTGDFIEGINYTYYYITLDNQSLINKAESYIEQADKLFDPAEKIRLKLLALEEYQRALVKDPGNRFLNDRASELVSNDGVQVNMLIQFILNIILVPIKIVICIIEYIVNFFTSLKVKELPTKIPEFLAFNWILEFFKPTKVLELLGMKLNPDFNPLYYAQALVSGSSFKFDASQIFSAPFLGKMPTYNAKEFPNIVEGGPKMLLAMGGVFCFLEGIINEILCFIFNILNLDKLFPCPEINLSRFINETLTAEQIENILSEADDAFLNQTSSINNQGAFLFDVELDNGEIVNGLNRSELQAFVASNRNLRFKYNFGKNDEAG